MRRRWSEEEVGEEEVKVHVGGRLGAKVRVRVGVRVGRERRAACSCCSSS